MSQLPLLRHFLFEFFDRFETGRPFCQRGRAFCRTETAKAFEADAIDEAKVRLQIRQL